LIMYKKNKFAYGSGRVLGFAQGVFFYNLMIQYDSIWTKGLFIFSCAMTFGETMGLYQSLKNMEEFEKTLPEEK
jgi:hypothetical protein